AFPDEPSRGFLTDRDELLNIAGAVDAVRIEEHPARGREIIARAAQQSEPLGDTRKAADRIAEIARDEAGGIAKPARNAAHRGREYRSWLHTASFVPPRRSLCGAMRGFPAGLERNICNFFRRTVRQMRGTSSQKWPLTRSR